MNEELYRALRELWVFPEPAAELAQMYDGGEYLTGKVLAAFLAHVRETGSIAIAVWRLRKGILTTGEQNADMIHIRDRRGELPTQRRRS